MEEEEREEVGKRERGEREREGGGGARECRNKRKVRDNGRWGMEGIVRNKGFCSLLPVPLNTLSYFAHSSLLKTQSFQEEGYDKGSFANHSSI